MASKVLKPRVVVGGLNVPNAITIVGYASLITIQTLKFAIGL